MIKQRNLDPSLIQWIMTTTGLGPGIGEIQYVAPAAASTSQFRTQLESMGVDNIHLLPSAAEAKMVAYRNDVMLIAPGAYAETAEIAWDKAWSHIIGLGGPNQLGDYSEPNVAIYTATANVANTINITGQNCIFVNANFSNNYADADNLSAIKLDKYGCYFKNVRAMGCMAATQAATALACSLWIRGGGMYPIFDDCTIGHDVWTTRSGANQGVILFNESNTQANGGLFRNCDILSVCETATGCFVAVVGNNVLGRGWKFQNCTFNNYTTGTRMNQAFYQSASNSINDRAIMLKDCILNTKGCDAWQDSDYGNIYGNQPASASAGGLVAEVSE